MIACIAGDSNQLLKFGQLFRDFFYGHREQIKPTGVIGQLYRNGGQIPGTDEHARGRTRAVLGCEPQSDYRTNRSASGAAVILWACTSLLSSPDDDSLLASLKSIELRDTNQKSTLNLTAKLPSLLTNVLWAAKLLEVPGATRRFREHLGVLCERCCADDLFKKPGCLELIKNGDFERLVVKRKDSIYSQRRSGTKSEIPATYSKQARQDFFQRQ